MMTSEDGQDEVTAGWGTAAKAGQSEETSAELQPGPGQSKALQEEGETQTRKRYR